MIRLLFRLLVKDPIGLKFTRGQRVFACCTHESLISLYTSPQPGKILCYAFNKKSYWSFGDAPSPWYYVKLKNGLILSLPTERLEDLSEYKDRTRKLINDNIHRVGEKGFSKEAFNRLSKYL